MNLIYHSVTIQNFMSVGDNPIVVPLDEPGVIALVGANGSGKSTLTVEAIGFCLFNKSFRGMTKGDLVNTKNRGGTKITVELTKGERRIKVVRGIKPDLFEIWVDGLMLEQTSAVTYQATLESILGFDFGIFIRTTMLGNANYMPFMTMKTGPRRDFVEDILSLEIFTGLNKTVKAELAEVKKSLDTKTTELAAKRAVLAEQHRINTKRAADQGSALQEAKNALAEDLRSIESLKNSAEELRKDPSLELLPKIRDKIAKTTDSIRTIDVEIALLQNEIRTAKELQKFFQNTTTCPTCRTDMSEDHCQEKVSDQMAIIREKTARLTSLGATKADLGLTLTKLQNGLQKIEGIQEKIRNSDDAVSRAVMQAKSRKSIIEQLQVQAAPEDTTATQAEIDRLTKEFVAIEQQVADYKVALELLDDGGVKATILRDIVPMLNQYVNEFLDVMGLGVRMEFNEEFDETLIGRYADEFSYTSLSQGERARLNLAVMFAWQQIQVISSGVQSNLLVIDEVGFADLDDQGVDAMFAILRKVWDNKTVYIICHSAYAHAQCDRTIGVTKEGGFTKLIMKE